MPELTNPGHERFAQEFVRCLSPSVAAERVGYSKDYGYHLTAHSKVEQRIAEIWQEVGTRLKVDQNTVLREAIWLATSDVTHVLGCANFQDLQDLPPGVRRAIKKVRRWDYEDGSSRLEVEMHDKIQALGLLAKATGADQGELDAEGGEEPVFTGMEVKFLTDESEEDQQEG